MSESTNLYFAAAEFPLSRIKQDRATSTETAEEMILTALCKTPR